MKPLVTLFFAIVLTTIDSTSLQNKNIPAFPGAQGFGASTPGGRGGEIIKVTNLNDKGPGSLRAALESSGPRIVIFMQGGIINLETKLEIRNPFITIAGQTSPGDGICIRGEGIRIYTHDVIIRYLRIRPGDINFGKENNWGALDAITMAGIPDKEDRAENIIIDHCSLSWAVDENVDMWYDTRNITLQNCIISEGLHKSRHPKRPHSSGMLIGDKSTNISVYRNLFAHNKDRNPLVNGQTLLDFRNNVIYNPGSAATDIVPNFEQQINYVGNFIFAGKNTYFPSEIIVRGKNYGKVQIYIRNNVTPNEPGRYADNWHIIKNIFKDSALHLSQRSRAPFPHPPVNTLTADDALEYVLKNAGAKLPVRDAIDRKVIDDVKTGRGNIIDSKSNIFEWPPYDEGLAPVDSDNDGMPDFWEEHYGLDPTNSNDNNEDTDQDGYLNIEEYINRTSPVAINNTSSLSLTDNTISENFVPFSLRQNVPNPFSDTTKITFTINSPSYTDVSIYNTSGELVKNLINGFLYEGKYEFYFDPVFLPEGIYMLHLNSGSYQKSIKLVHKKNI